METRQIEISGHDCILLVFSNILVAVDGSKSADKAFKQALYLAQKCNSKLDLVHVVSCELGGDSANTFEILEELKEKAQKMLEGYKIEATKINVPIQITVTQGDPAKVIIDLQLSKIMISSLWEQEADHLFKSC